MSKKYSRTWSAWSLDEICYVMDMISNESSVDEIAIYTQRAPWMIKFKFYEIRPVNPDGTLDYSRSVERFGYVDWLQEELDALEKEA